MNVRMRLNAWCSARTKTFPPVLTLERTNVDEKGAVGTGIMARVFLRFPNRFPLQEGPCNNIFLLEPVRPINKQRERTDLNLKQFVRGVARHLVGQYYFMVTNGRISLSLSLVTEIREVKPPHRRNTKIICDGGN